MNNKLLNYVEEARSLLAKRGGWCQGGAAQSKDGMPRTSSSEDAVSFCAMGAVWRVTNHNRVASDKILTLLEEFLPYDTCGLLFYNDEKRRRKRDVVSLFDKAAAKLRAQYTARKKRRA